MKYLLACLLLAFMGTTCSGITENKTNDTSVDVHGSGDNVVAPQDIITDIINAELEQIIFACTNCCKRCVGNPVDGATDNECKDECETKNECEKAPGFIEECRRTSEGE